MEEQPCENITIEIENVETVNITIESQEPCEEHVCNCDMTDPTVEHGPLCPGAVKPEITEVPTPVPVEETPVETASEPVEETPVETAPEPVVEETPVETAPVPVVEETPVETAPVPVVEETPVETAPVPVVETTEPQPTQETTAEREGASGGTVGSLDIPDLIFIVPYRDREQQQKFFSQQMKVVLEDIPENKYKIYYIHQNDKREFNRGAMKNIGFLMVKNKYPNDYKNITLVFNDVDTMPYSKNFINYYTTPGTIKHFYGFRYALGGIVSITAGDFEKTGGFPNFWSWGYEDNLLNKRVLKAGLTINRDQFYDIMDKNMFQMKDGLARLVNRGEFDRYLSNTTEGYHTIQGLQYIIDEVNGFVNVNQFNTGVVINQEQNKIHDLRNGNRPFPVMMNKRRMPRMGMNL
uniref:Galactosyltransferase C-terminal domain-containing protein n=1 Tax=viral metagenome TaxID=1070528 RepID=A0A6C0KJ87_9ZZZZ